MPTIQIKALSKGAGFVAFCALLTLRSGGRLDYLRAGAPLVQTLFSDAFDADLLREAFATFSSDEKGREVSVFRRLTIQTPKEGVRGAFEPDEAAQSILQASDEELYLAAEALLGWPKGLAVRFFAWLPHEQGERDFKSLGRALQFNSLAEGKRLRAPEEFSFSRKPALCPFCHRKGLEVVARDAGAMKLVRDAHGRVGFAVEEHKVIKPAWICPRCGLALWKTARR